MMARWRSTLPPTAATACSGPVPTPELSRTTTWTWAADDGVAASAATGPTTPTPTAAATATVANRRACMGRPPHVTPKESGPPGLRSRSELHIPVLLTVGTAMCVDMCDRWFGTECEELYARGIGSTRRITPRGEGAARGPPHGFKW